MGVTPVRSDERNLNFRTFDTLGAILGTAGMLLLIFGLVRAPDNGWGAGTTIGELAGAAVLLIAFAVNEARAANPLVPLPIFRIRGLGAADAVQVLAMAGFYSVFFFVTLYLQNVLGFSPTRAGAAYVPVALLVTVSAIIGSALITRLGSRPLIVAGALIAAGGVFWLSRIPAHGSYFADVFPGMMVMALGLGGVFVGVQTAANAGRAAGARRAGERPDQRVLPGRRGARAGGAVRRGHLADPVAAGRARDLARWPSRPGSTGRCWSPASSWSPRR